MSYLATVYSLDMRYTITYTGNMDIHEFTKQLMKEHGGFIPSMVLADAIRERNPEKWIAVPNQEIARQVALSLRQYGLEPKNTRFGKRVLKGYGKPNRAVITDV